MIVSLSQFYIPCILGAIIASLSLGLYVWLRFRRKRLKEASHQLLPKNIKLSPRQMVVWGLIAKGAANKEIAEELGIGENTVKQYCSEIYYRLGVRNRVEASRMFLESNKGRWCKLKPSLFCQEGYCLECEICKNHYEMSRQQVNRIKKGSDT